MLNNIIYREILTTLRNTHILLQPLLFFILTLLLFPIALGADNNTLRQTAPAALWIALLLASLLAAGQLFQHDFDDGTLAQDCIHFQEFWLVILAKLLTIWLRFILPLLLTLPLLALMFHIPLQHLPKIALLLFCGSFTLLLLGGVGAALTLTQNHNSFLLFLITLPFYIPALIIGATATHDAVLGLSIDGQLALLTALMLFTILTALPFTTLAIKSQSL